MRIAKATRKFENWLRERTTVVKPDLDAKHRLMAEDPFSFLRGTFYRWAQAWESLCPECAEAPEVLAVGDLHVGNFGTWRDGEGRLAWGVNDFDEAYHLPYTNDLIRLAVSAHLAATSGRLKLRGATVAKMILGGYVECLKTGGRPIVLEEHHSWLRAIALNGLRNPQDFWKKLDELPTVKDAPKSARKALRSMLPEDGTEFRVAHRVAGVGSLGHERYVAIANWNGNRIAREAKALTPSACLWANGNGSDRILYREILETACRDQDPLVQLRGRWFVRRIGPDCSRIDLVSLPARIDEKRLLGHMGFETANIHFGSGRVMKAVRKDLASRRKDWLHKAMQKMIDSVTDDFDDWRQEHSN